MCILFMFSLLLWGMTAECQNTQSNSGDMDQNFMQEEQKALKAIFSDKEILNNYNGAVVKDGEIVELTRANEDNGILFWHEHSPEWQDIIPAGVCRIYDPSWENITMESPAGVLKFQLLPTSPYANQAPSTITLHLGVNSPEAINAFEAVDPTVPNNGFNFNEYFFTDSWLTDASNMFVHNYVITENPHYAGAFDGYNTFFRPSGMGFEFYSTHYSTDPYYAQTEYSNPNNQPIYTLRSGNYIPLLIISYLNQSNPGTKFYVLKWLNLRVENYYLGDVGVENHDAQQEQMYVYPNPTTGNVNVRCSMNNEQLVDGEIQVFDVYGRRLSVVGTRCTTSLQTIQIDLSNYLTGIYIIKFVNNGRVMATDKVVKQ